MPTVQLLRPMSWTPESLNQISPNFYKTYRNDCRLYSAEIKIVIFQSVSERQGHYWTEVHQICTRLAGLLPFNLLKAFNLSAVQLLLPKTLGSLNRISPNFHKMYRNDCGLTAEIKSLIFRSVSEYQRAKWTSSNCSRGRFSIFAVLNSEVTDRSPPKFHTM